MSPLREHLSWTRLRRPCSFLPWLRLNGFRSSKPCHSPCHSRVRIWCYTTTRSSVRRRSLLPILFPVLSLFRLYRTLLATCPREFIALSELLSTFVKLQGQLRSFRRGCSSHLGILNVLCRRMPCHSIFDSGAMSSARPPRAHDIRGISTSLNYYSNLSLSNLMQVATWRSNCVFASRYLKEVSATQDNIQQFGPMVIAGDRLKPKTPQRKHRL